MILQFEQVVSSTFPQNVGFFCYEKLGWILGWMGLGIFQKQRESTTYMGQMGHLDGFRVPNIHVD
jgi:uncharacterized membrane protein YGL010W